MKKVQIKCHTVVTEGLEEPRRKRGRYVVGSAPEDMLFDVLQKISEQEKMPEEWRDSVIAPIFKEKGDIQDCGGNYRGINMISHTMTIWEK